MMLYCSMRPQPLLRAVMQRLQQAAIQAQEALDSGKALAALDNLIAITNDKA